MYLFAKSDAKQICNVFIITATMDNTSATEFCLITFHDNMERQIYRISDILAANKKGRYKIPATPTILKETNYGSLRTLLIICGDTARAVTVEKTARKYEDR